MQCDYAMYYDDVVTNDVYYAMWAVKLATIYSLMWKISGENYYK